MVTQCYRKGINNIWEWSPNIKLTKKKSRRNEIFGVEKKMKRNFKTQEHMYLGNYLFVAAIPVSKARSGWGLHVQPHVRSYCLSFTFE